MPCSDSSSSIVIKLDSNERLRSFEYAKITCGQEINAASGLLNFLKGKTLEEILDQPYSHVENSLKPANEEAEFILFLEWNALRSAIVQYLGVDREDVDKDRCLITSIVATEEGVEIAEIILPPKDLPKIISCGNSEETETKD